MLDLPDNLIAHVLALDEARARADLQTATMSSGRDAAIGRLGRALVAPCTTTIRALPSEVVLEPGDDPIPRRSAVNLNSVESVSLAVLVSRLGRPADARMREICGALEVAVDGQS